MPSVPSMVYSDESGQIYDHPRLKMAVFDGYQIRAPHSDELVPLPEGSDFYLLPGRLPLGFSGKRSHLIEYAGDESQRVAAVSAFIAPAYLRLNHPAFRTLPEASTLPLFAYAPLGWSDGVFWTTALRIDPDKRQDPALFDTAVITNAVARDLRKYPDNRLLQQLRRCALDYGCRAAQNFFLKRWECPLPTAMKCNSRCVGCISHQEGEIPVTQERLNFHPTADEIVQVAGLHFSRVKNPIASFGQGCEGEPLTRGQVLVDAVRRLRDEFPQATINLNSNASKPDLVADLFGAGLSSMRVSMASPTAKLYDLYHQPRGYTFADVLRSISAAKEHAGQVSLNLLVFPGLTDRGSEMDALESLLKDYGIDMIQWRNMNIDPEYYLAAMGRGDSGIGLHSMVHHLRKQFPKLRHGYFNPFLERDDA